MGGKDSQIGTGAVGIDAEDPGGIAQAANFSAVADEWNGETIISFRGIELGAKIFEPAFGWKWFFTNVTTRNDCWWWRWVFLEW